MARDATMPFAVQTLSLKGLVLIRKKYSYQPPTGHPWWLFLLSTNIKMKQNER